MNGEDRRAFAAAFAEAVRPDDADGQSGKRMLMAAFAAVLAVALGAVVYGALRSTGPEAPGAPAAASPSDTTAPTQSSAGGAAGSGAPAQARWTAVAGPTCHGDGTSFSTSGYGAGWATWRSGGYHGTGCGGGFVSVPMSGQARAYDTKQFALWKFHLATKFTTATCQLSTYVPGSTELSWVGGDPTYYEYYGNNYSGSTGHAPLGEYSVYQVSHRGSWVIDATFPVTTGWVTVKLINAGQTAVNARHAAAQVRLACEAP